MKKIFDIDCIGMCASVLCLIHCLCLPWLVALVGVYFGSFFESPNFHNIMLVVAILIGLPVFILSFVRYKSKLILITGVVGLSLTTLGTMKSDNCCATTGTETVCAEGSACSTEECATVEAVCAEGSDCSTEECATVEVICSEDSDCGSECAETETAKLSDNIEDASEEEVVPTEIQSFNTVPLGVGFLIFAHLLNFRKRKSCKHDCCS